MKKKKTISCRISTDSNRFCFCVPFVKLWKKKREKEEEGNREEKKGEEGKGEKGKGEKRKGEEGQKQLH